MRVLTEDEILLVSGGLDNGKYYIIINEYSPASGIDTGHVNVTYHDASGNEVTYGQNILANEINNQTDGSGLHLPGYNSSMASSGVYNETWYRADAIADGRVASHNGEVGTAYEVTSTQFYASRGEAESLAAATASGGGPGYSLTGNNCIDFVTHMAQIAGKTTGDVVGGLIGNSAFNATDVYTVVMGAANAVGLGGAWNTMGSITSEVWEDFGEIGSGLSDAWDSFTQGDLWGAVWTTLETIGSGIANIFGDIAEGLGFYNSSDYNNNTDFQDYYYAGDYGNGYDPWDWGNC